MDDLANNYRRYMDSPAGGLDYPGVEACLRAVPWPLAKCVAQVTPEGLGRNNIFSHLGILQLCLFGCPPFRDLIESQVRDVRADDRNKRIPKKLQIRDCPHRADLLEDLARALLVYECRYIYTWPRFASDRHQAMVFFKDVISLLTELHRRGIALADPDLRHRRLDSLVKDIHHARNIVMKIRPIDEYQVGGAHHLLPHPAERPAKYFLLQTMAQAFRTHGPSKFSQDAINYAMVAILKSLGIPNEQEKSYTAPAIKKLLSRLPDIENRDN